MKIKTLEEKKKQKMLMIIALAIILAAFLILYFGFINKGTEVSIDNTFQNASEENNMATMAAGEQLKAIKLDTEFLINEILSVLKTNGDMPVKKGVTGRPNPFAK